MGISIVAVPICSLHPFLGNLQALSLITTFTYEKSSCLANGPLNRAEQVEISLECSKPRQPRHQEGFSNSNIELARSPFTEHCKFQMCKSIILTDITVDLQIFTQLRYHHKITIKAILCLILPIDYSRYEGWRTLLPRFPDIPLPQKESEDSGIDTEILYFIVKC